MQGEVVKNQGTASMNVGGRSEKVKNDHLEELERAPLLQEQGGDDKKRKHKQVEEPELPSGPFLGDNQALKRCREEFMEEDLVASLTEEEAAEGPVSPLSSGEERGGGSGAGVGGGSELPDSGLYLAGGGAVGRRVKCWWEM
jgi:hypothetical protein